MAGKEPYLPAREFPQGGEDDKVERHDAADGVAGESENKNLPAGSFQSRKSERLARLHLHLQSGSNG